MPGREKSCCFFGNIIVSDAVKPKLFKAVWKAIKEGYRDFYVGSYVGFDQKALDVLKEAKKVCPDIQIYCVLNYYSESRLTGDEDQKSDAYEIRTIFLGEAEAPLKKRIEACNHSIAERCSLAICCAFEDTFFGVADEASRYAARIGIKTIDLFDEKERMDFKTLLNQ